jgi:hypothetical protein
MKLAGSAELLLLRHKRKRQARRLAVNDVSPKEEEGKDISRPLRRRKQAMELLNHAALHKSTAFCAMPQ